MNLLELFACDDANVNHQWDSADFHAIKHRIFYTWKKNHFPSEWKRRKTLGKLFTKVKHPDKFSQDVSWLNSV